MYQIKSNGLYMNTYTIWSTNPNEGYAWERKEDADTVAQTMKTAEVVPSEKDTILYTAESECGYVYFATQAHEANIIDFWHALTSEGIFFIVKKYKAVPYAVAQMQLKQGTREQEYSDGYIAGRDLQTLKCEELYRNEVDFIE